MDDDWVRIPYGYAIGPPCRFEPLHIKPGEVNLDTLRMGARFDPEGAPEPMWTEVISVTGLYRLEQQVYLIDLFGDRPDSLLPSLDLVSQEFEIRPRYNSPLQMQRARQDPEAR